MRRPLLLTAMLLVLAASLPASAQPRQSLVTIVHGLPRFTADIYVDGELFLSGFRPEQATDPVELAVGTYHVEIREVGAPADSSPVLEADLSVPGDKDLSVIAHLDENGEPTVSVFENEVGDVPPGRSRLSLRHQAEAAPVQLMVDGTPLLARVASGEEDGTAIPAATHDVEVVAEDGASLVPRSSLQFEEGTAYFLYLIGSTTEGTLDLMVQRATGLASPPSGVATGDGGLADESGLPPWAMVLMLGAALALAITGREVARR
jgi:hypothetical protein